jgi:choline dehydrogenase-like flavoprotein
MRRWGFAYPGDNLGGAGAHWAGVCYRFNETEFRLRSHYTEKYGAAIMEGLTSQDWPVTYGDLEPHYERYEALAGISGNAGNVNGQTAPDANPFDAPRKKNYPNPPMKVPFAAALFGEAAARLGYHSYIQPSALVTRPYTNSEGLKHELLLLLRLLRAPRLRAFRQGITQYLHPARGPEAANLRTAHQRSCPAHRADAGQEARDWRHLCR